MGRDREHDAERIARALGRAETAFYIDWDGWRVFPREQQLTSSTGTNLPAVCTHGVPRKDENCGDCDLTIWALYRARGAI